MKDSKTVKEGYFAEMFVSSAKNLSRITTLTTSGLLIAMAIALRATAVQISPDARVTVQFLPLCIIALLFGPVVSMMGAFATDLIGFMIDSTGQAYLPWLTVSAVLAGLIYGIFLYRKNTDFVISISAITARITVVLLCSICLNSYVFFAMRFPGYNIFTEENGIAFFIAQSSIRIGRSLLMLPIDLALLCVILPLANAAYRRVKKNF